MSNGKHYLEAHHVIALCDQGKDTEENVIALCPEHHRQAHYGTNAEALEKKFIECIGNRQLNKTLKSGEANAVSRASTEKCFLTSEPESL